MILSHLPIESPAHSEKLEGICFHRRMGQFVNAISNSIWQHSQKVILAPCTTHCSFTEEHYSPSVNKSSQAHHGLYQLLPVHDYCPQLDSNEPPNSAFLVGELPYVGTPRAALQPGKLQAAGCFMGYSYSPHVGSDIQSRTNTSGLQMWQE